MIQLLMIVEMFNCAAFVVRFLTRRFIGDYDPKLERCYPVNTTFNGEHVMLELLDSGGHHLEV
jgi:hypothetical protein